MKKTLGYEINEFEYEKFSSEFIYDETEDQKKAIEDVIEDLCSEKLMDRLVCGDVGFGKNRDCFKSSFYLRIKLQTGRCLSSNNIAC